MARRQIAVGSIIAMIGGFGIAKLADALQLGAGFTAIAFFALVLGLLVAQMGRQPDPPGPAARPR